MSYNDDLRILLPDSILNIKPGSNNSKLWGLFSTQMDAIDQLLEDMRLLRDFMSQ